MSPPAAVVLIPVFNDWESAALVVARLDRSLRVLVVDDGSTAEPPSDFGESFADMAGADLVRLKGNLGHQRAIAVGLYVIERQIPAPAVVIMDGDGEDRPEDVAVLLGEFRKRGDAVVFAARVKRMEGPVFQIFYQLYRATHWMLTGIAVRVGNFSVLPEAAVSRLMVSPDLWNHYAASVFRSRIPFTTVPLDRGKRLRGRSRMNFAALVVHGLSAISVFGDIAATRLLLLTVLGALAVLAASPWTVAALALVVETTILAALSVFLIIGLRSHMTFLPLRDAGHFIESVKPLKPASELKNLEQSLEQWRNSPTPVTN
jgi:hypothetical protein